MRNTLNTLGMSVVIGFVVAFYMAMAEGFIFDGLSIGYTLMGWLFPYAFEDQLITLFFTITTTACATVERTYIPYTQTRRYRRYQARQQHMRTNAPPSTYTIALPAMPILKAHTVVEHIHTHPVLPTN